MMKFHKNLNIMSGFTAALIIVACFFWKTFMNIAISNVFLNGIIIGTTIFGIGLCFINMFKLLPEYRWLHAYFEGDATRGFNPKLLSPISNTLRNKHIAITSTDLTDLLNLVLMKIEDKRDSVRYITNSLIFLGLLGTFWGLIVTVGGFADLIIHIDFADTSVLQNMQSGMAVPLAGMATAFTSSLLGLAGSLIVGFLGLQLQFAQNTIFQDLTDFMTEYVLEHPNQNSVVSEMIDTAPLSQAVYSTINDMYNVFVDYGYKIKDIIRIDGKYPAVVALGSNEALFIGTVNVPTDVLQNTIKRLNLCFADTLEDITITPRVFCIDGTTSARNEDIVHFASVNAFKNYMFHNQNMPLQTDDDQEAFVAYENYIENVLDYLFNPGFEWEDNKEDNA